MNFQHSINFDKRERGLAFGGRQHLYLGLCMKREIQPPAIKVSKLALKSNKTANGGMVLPAEGDDGILSCEMKPAGTIKRGWCLQWVQTCLPPPSAAKSFKQLDRQKCAPAKIEQGLFPLIFFFWKKDGWGVGEKVQNQNQLLAIYCSSYGRTPLISNYLNTDCSVIDYTSNDSTFLNKPTNKQKHNNKKQTSKKQKNKNKKPWT